MKHPDLSMNRMVGVLIVTVVILLLISMPRPTTTKIKPLPPEVECIVKYTTDAVYAQRRNDINAIASRLTIKEVKEGRLADLLQGINFNPPTQFFVITRDGWYVSILSEPHTNRIDFQKD